MVQVNLCLINDDYDTLEAISEGFPGACIDADFQADSQAPQSGGAFTNPLTYFKH